jgi:hypothetical protein
MAILVVETFPVVEKGDVAETFLVITPPLLIHYYPQLSIVFPQIPTSHGVLAAFSETQTRGTVSEESRFHK